MTTPLLNDETLIKLIQEEGLFSRCIKGFEPREQQALMMKGVIDAYNENQIALIEAGTGTGKSLSYLIPALILAAKHGERTVISTNTIALQEQLLYKDIPAILKALNLSLEVVLVKGMNNYICLRKLEDAHYEQSFFPTEENHEIEKIEACLNTQCDGSKSSLSFKPSFSTWERVCVEKTACLRNECPHFKRCHFYKARRDTQEAQILIVNHHLLFTDLVKKGELDKYDEGAILPPYKRIIIDEAHHIEDSATEHFALRLTKFELLRVLSRLTAERSPTGLGKLTLLKEKIQSMNLNAFNSLSQILQILNLNLPAIRHDLNEMIHDTFDTCSQLISESYVSSKKPQTEESNFEQKCRILPKHTAQDIWKHQIIKKADALIHTLNTYSETLNNLETLFKSICEEKTHDMTKSVRLDIQSLNNDLISYKNQLQNFFFEEFSPEKVYWIENQLFKGQNNVHLVKANLDISRFLSDFLFNKFSTTILCSATLTSNRKFDFTRQRLGIIPSLIPDKNVTEYIFDSTFDYQKQALLAAPTDILAPTDPQFASDASENIWRIVNITAGGVFVLFTSYGLLNKCAEYLEERIKTQGYTLLRQGHCSRKELISRFKTTPRSILFGTDSFWEGVDVAGDALRCVIIVKLPFKVPSEPLIQAKTEAILSKGGEPFLELSLPQAIMKFKQGFGRLIRNKWDRGCIVCLDNRLVHKNYGQMFLNSLPPCKRLFSDKETLYQEMKEFYKRTAFLARQNPISY